MQCGVGGCDASASEIAPDYGSGIAVRGGYVYFAGNGALSQVEVVERCPVGGCGSHAPLTYGVASPSDAGDAGSEGGINEAPVTDSIVGIAVDSQNVYWTGSRASPAGAWVLKCSIDGCTEPTVVAAAQAPSGIAVDSTSVYWTDTRAGTVSKRALGGCTQPTVLVSGLATGGGSGPATLAVAGTNVYWTNTSDGTLSKCATTGCAQPIVIASNLAVGALPITDARITDLAADESNVYWTNVDDAGAHVLKCSATGCTAPMVLYSTNTASSASITQFCGPFLVQPGIAIDSTRVYFIGADPNSQPALMSLPK
jgi:hypothetical protein